MSWMLQLRNQNPNIFWMIQFLCSSFQPVNRVVDDIPSWRSSAHGEFASTLRSFRAPTVRWNVVAHPMRCDGVHPWWIAVGNGRFLWVMCVFFSFELLYTVRELSITNMIEYVMLIWLIIFSTVRIQHYFRLQAHVHFQSFVSSCTFISFLGMTIFMHPDVNKPTPCLLLI